MKIMVTFNLSADDSTQLAGILRCKTAELEKSIEPHVRAAAEEYVRMFLGQRVFTRGSDIREYRLFLLIREAFRRVPDEQQACDLFQTTTSQSRSLIRSVLSKYQYDLRPIVDSSLKEAIKSAVPDGADLLLTTVKSENVIDALNRTVETLDGTLPQIERKRGSVSSYTLKRSTAARLKKHFGLT